MHYIEKRVERDSFSAKQQQNQTQTNIIHSIFISILFSSVRFGFSSAGSFRPKYRERQQKQPDLF